MTQILRTRPVFLLLGRLMTCIFIGAIVFSIYELVVKQDLRSLGTGTAAAWLGLEWWFLISRRENGDSRQAVDTVVPIDMEAGN